MFGSHLLDRRSKPERIAEHAWEHLVATVNTAGDSVRNGARDTARSARLTTTQFTDDTGDRVGAIANEAWQRATRAYDVLTGRRPALPWAWLVGAGLVGAAIGWAATTAARVTMNRAEDEMSESDRLEFVDVHPDPTVRADS